ncbi:MAG: hypothetical protein JWN64_551 [Parcubacteria group bacterium]|nr:hypothetical protein [Parcubacteria group bacterium]
MAAPKATQAFVPVKEVRNGVVILKDDGYRGILMCSSVNFALKSEDEQRAIVGGFQNFLNTLDFSVEIVAHSRRMDIRPYLALLQERMAFQTSDLMRLQLREYMQFIKSFLETTDIMTKIFYLVIPYAPAIANEVAGNIPFIGRKSTSETPGEDSFNEHRVQLEQRMALAAGGLASAGVRAVPLGTEEIIELLYHSFNLGDVETPIPLTNS